MCRTIMTVGLTSLALAPLLALAAPNYSPSVDTLLRQLRSEDSLERRAAAKAREEQREFVVWKIGGMIEENESSFLLFLRSPRT